MTNQEKMCKLSPEDFYAKMCWLFTYGKVFTDSRTAIIDWLKLNDNVHNVIKEFPKGFTYDELYKS